MELGLFLLMFLTTAVAIFAFGVALAGPRSVMVTRLFSFTGRQFKQDQPARERFEQAMEPLSRAMPKSPSEVSRTRAWLMQAGYRESRHLTIYYGVRVLMLIVVLAVAMTIGLWAKAPLLALGLGAMAFILPRFILKRRIARRQHKIRLALPDALDLAVICVEAGLALDQSLQRVGDDLKHVHPELSDELNLVNLELRAGKARAEALRNLGARTAVDDVRALVAVLVQTDRFGTSIANALRVHSDALRVERRQRAEEQAAKTTIKMVPVLVFFVFPSMFMVTLGPAAIQLLRHLMPVIQK